MPDPAAPLTPLALALVPVVGHAVASPTDRLVAVVVEVDALSHLALYPLDGGPGRRLTADVAPTGARLWGPREIDWSPDGRRLAFVADVAGRQNVWAIEVDSGELTRVTNHGWPERTPHWSPDGRSLAVVTEVDGQDWIGVVDAAGGWPRRVTDPAFASSDPAWAPDGNALAFVSKRDGDARGHNRDIWVVDLGTSEETRLTEPDGNADTEPAWSPDGERIAFVSERTGWKLIWTMDRGGGDRRRLAPEDAEQTEPVWSPDGRHLAWVVRRGVEVGVDAADAASGALVQVASSGVGGSVASLSWVADGTALCVVESTPTTARDVQLRPIGGGETSAVTSSMPAALAAHRLIEPTSVWIESADKVRCQGLLFVPPEAKPGEGRAALVYAHGGPTWQVEQRWLPDVQHLVAEGYTVLAPNFRGSTGYGRGFDRANDGDWGGGDLEDCVAAADHLRGLPWVAADRVGIWGASYGGYLTLLALGKRPDAFQAGVDLFGSSDEATLWMQTDAPGRRGIEEEVGVPRLNLAAFRSGAPLHYAERIRSPLLMLHGEEDRRVTLEQSEAMRRSLERLGKVFEYHRYPGEAHGFRKIDNWVDSQERTVDFLGRYL